MHKNRLEAFSDGVIAIIITIMVLELKVPHGDHLSDLLHLGPKFLSYLMSFIYVGIYWNNHHHLFQAATRVNGKILWANVHFLLWLSLAPFASAWMGESAFSSTPVALYGVVLLMAGFSYFILSKTLINEHGKESTIAKAVGSTSKEMLSVALYAASIPLAYYSAFASCAIYAGVAIMWLIPDQRIERQFQKEHRQ